MDYNKTIPTTPQFQDHLLWWLQEVNLGKGFHWKKNCPSGTLITDGSLDGWGAYLWSNVIQGKWDQLQERYRINLLELLAVWNVLKHLSHDKGVSCNNSDRQQNSCELNHETRGTPFTNTVYLDLKKMWTWWISQNHQQSATHIAGVNNKIADALSRIRSELTVSRLSQCPT